VHQYRAHAKNCDRVRAFYLLVPQIWEFFDVPTTTSLERYIVRKLFLALLVVFALFVLINAYAGVVADRSPGNEATRAATTGI
jgi:hypothetical protein